MGPPQPAGHAGAWPAVLEEWKNYFAFFFAVFFFAGFLALVAFFAAALFDFAFFIITSPLGG